MEKNKSLSKALLEYALTDAYPFHMPGHKRNPEFMQLGEPVRMDITEIDGFDNLHHAEGILKEAQERAARVRGAERTWFLINGSTSGLLAAIAACTRRGEHLLMARNCHKAVYNAVEIGGLSPVYIYPKIHEKFGIYEAVDAEEVSRMMETYPEIRAVVITSPTYEGVVSDIDSIAQAVHDHKGVLIVDSAHGAHLGYSGSFPKSAVACGADIVIESIHKTLPSMTQTSLLHCCSDRVSQERLCKYLSLYQTSSPSYVMMASIDQCMELLFSDRERLFSEFYEKLQRTTHFLKTELKYIKLLDQEQLCEVPGSDFDPSKIVLYAGAGKGRWLYDELREVYKLQMEMASADYVLAMTSICDTQEGFSRLCAALCEIDQKILLSLQKNADGCAEWSEVASHIKSFEKGSDKGFADKSSDKSLQRFHELIPTLTKPVLTSSTADEYPSEWIDLEASSGRISGCYLYVYPPGVPFVVPGERICAQTLRLIERYEKAGLEVSGFSQEHKGKIRVLMCDA